MPVGHAHGNAKKCSECIWKSKSLKTALCFKSLAVPPSLEQEQNLPHFFSCILVQDEVSYLGLFRVFVDAPNPLKEQPSRTLLCIIFDLCLANKRSLDWRALHFISPCHCLWGLRCPNRLQFQIQPNLESLRFQLRFLHFSTDLKAIRLWFCGAPLSGALCDFKLPRFCCDLKSLRFDFAIWASKLLGGFWAGCLRQSFVFSSRISPKITEEPPSKRHPSRKKTSMIYKKQIKIKIGCVSVFFISVSNETPFVWPILCVLPLRGGALGMCVLNDVIREKLPTLSNWLLAFLLLMSFVIVVAVPCLYWLRPYACMLFIVLGLVFMLLLYHAWFVSLVLSCSTFLQPGWAH